MSHIGFDFLSFEKAVFQSWYFQNSYETDATKLHKYSLFFILYSSQIFFIQELCARLML